MPRRSELNGIADGMLGSFVSRNNDIDGYWAIGKLCAHAIQNGVTSVDVDLVAQTISPVNNAFQPMLERYARMLSEKLRTNGLQPSILAAAKLRLTFDFQLPGSSPLRTRSAQFESTLELSDDLGRAHIARRGGNTRPHDPRREVRSRRTVTSHSS